MREYKITPPNGIPTTIQLDDAEAKRLGLAAVEDDKPVKTKLRTPRNKAAEKRATVVKSGWGAKPEEGDEDE